MGDCTLVLAFTLVDRRCSYRPVGGGSRRWRFLLYKSVGWRTKQPSRQRLLLWLITFAGCSIAGIPLLIREGVSLGQLRELAEQEKRSAHRNCLARQRSN